MARKIIIDCDPGHDDALAIMLAAGNPEIELLAITTVGGNQILEKVTRNALAVATVAGIDVPIAAGARHPLVRPVLIAPEIHGESGLDGPVLPEPKVRLQDGHAVQLIIDTIMRHGEGEVTLVPTGPLTNIALAARIEPRIVERVAEVILMGGGYTRGNTTPSAEFNIVADPEAAEAVFQAGWRKITMVGLDVTHLALATPDVVARIGAIDSPLAHFVVDILGFFGRTYKEQQGFDFPPVHDPVTVAALIDSSIMPTRSAFVTVETQGRWTTGETVVDFAQLLAQPHNAQVGVGLDAEKFWNLIIDAIHVLSR